MAELAQLLERTISPDPNDQQTALNVLDNASQFNYPEFMRQLAIVLSDTQNKPFVRTAAGLQIKNALVAREQASADLKRNRWLAIPVEVRDFIKKSILQAVGTENRPSTAAQCIAAIACIEFPQNQWPELIDQLIANVTSEGANNSLLKEASLETLGYIGLDMSEKQKVGPVLAAIVRGMQSETASVHVKLAATKALSEIVDWVVTRTLEEHVDAIVDAACEYLQTAELNLYEEAAKCLWKIASRKCSKTAEEPIVVSMFRDVPIRQILTAANLAAEVSSSSYEHYKYLKALCDLLCALGIHLANIWSYVMIPPPNFSLYLSALSSFFLHPSIYIRAETAQVLAIFFGHERISQNEDFRKTIPPLIHFLPKAMSKSCCPYSDNQDLTAQYSQMDYENEVEQQREYIRLRDHCMKIINECASDKDHFDKLLSVARDWIFNRCVTTPEQIRSDEWDVMKRFLAAISVTRSGVNNQDEFIAYFDAVLNCSIKIFSSVISPSQQRLLNGVLSILSALFWVLDMDNERIPLMLEHLKSILMLDNSAQDMDIMATKRHSIALLLKMVSSCGFPIKEYGQTVLELVQSVSPYVSLMQRANLIPILAALSNHAASIDVQAAFLNTSIQADVDYIVNEPFSESPANFLAYSGLTTVSDAEAVASQQCPFYQNRLTLKAHLTALEGSLNQINENLIRTPEASAKIFALFKPAVSKFLKFCICLNSLYAPQNSALIHPFYGPSILDMGPSERLTIVSSLNLESMDISGKRADDYESSQATSTNGISTPDSSIFMRRFISEITDLIQSIVGLICSRFYHDFYALPGVAEAIERICTSVEYVPNFRIRFWIRRTWSRVVCSCPNTRSEVILAFMKKTTEHMQKRLVEQWELLKRKQSSDKDTESSEEEMIEASTMSLLSRECASFMSAFVFGETYSPKNALKDELISPIAHAVLTNKEIFVEILGLLAKLITCPDSQAAVKCVPVLNMLISNYHQTVDEQTAVPLLIHTIQSLQMYISDELAAGPLLTLIFNIYASLRPTHPALLEVLRQIPNCLPENIDQFDQRILGLQKMEDGKLHDKVKRDLMRRVLVSTKIKVHHKRNPRDNGIEECAEMIE